MSENTCDICLGTTKNLFNETCPYCNGTGEWNPAAQSYKNNHICQCIFLDRKFCPICKKICHHDTSASPKQIIDSGYGGMGNVKSNIVTNTTSNEELKEEEIVA